MNEELKLQVKYPYIDQQIRRTRFKLRADVSNELIKSDVEYLPYIEKLLIKFNNETKITNDDYELIGKLKSMGINDPYEIKKMNEEYVEIKNDIELEK